MTITDSTNNFLEEATLEELKEAYMEADSNNERVAIANEIDRRKTSEEFECSMSPECPCEDCQKNNVIMDR